MKSSYNGSNSRNSIIEKMNFLGKAQKPFIFIIDYGLRDYLVVPLKEIQNEKLFFDVNGVKNHVRQTDLMPDDIQIKKYPIAFEKYYSAFQEAQKRLSYGDSFLINLTFPTKIECNLSLSDIFYASRAKYKLYVPDKFVVFSPETFVQINNGVISSYPMKGTIDASEAFAKSKILADPKELAEHTTIVDLIRNDMSTIAHGVYVENFRYIDKIETNEKNLLQVSSKISGLLDKDYPSRIGDIICSMLPAGSVTGAPKPKTIEIINSIEGYDRGFYTGVLGYFDGRNLDSGVMIRFIEKQDNDLFFKSGGGITVNSDAKKEYQELIDKVYVPIDRIAENPGRATLPC